MMKILRAATCTHQDGAAVDWGGASMADLIHWIQGHRALVGWLGGLSLILFVVTLIVTPLVIIIIPRDYFVGPKKNRSYWSQRWPILHILLRIVRNGMGIAFVLAGLAMLILPGQGLVSILIGVMMIDFPGKYAFEKWLVSRSSVFRFMTWVRSKAKRPPLAF